MKLLKSSTKYLEGLHDKISNSGNEQQITHLKIVRIVALYKIVDLTFKFIVWLIFSKYSVQKFKSYFSNFEHNFENN